MKLLFLLQGTTQNHNTDIIVVNNDNNNKNRGISDAATTTKTALTEPIKRSANYDSGVCFVRVLLCLKSLSANSPLYICTKCFIYYKLVFCVAFFLFRSSTYTLAASFIHFRQLCKRSLFFFV